MFPQNEAEALVLRMKLRQALMEQAVEQGLSHRQAAKLAERLHQDGTLTLKAEEAAKALAKHTEEVVRLQALSMVLLEQDTLQQSA